MTNIIDEERDLMSVLATMGLYNDDIDAGYPDDTDDESDDFDVIDFSDMDLDSELPSVKAKRASKSTGKRKRKVNKEEDDDVSDGEDIIEKGISFTDSQNFRDKLGEKDGYTYKMSHTTSREFIFAMRQKLMDAGMSLEDIVKYVKFYFFSWQGDFYVSAIFNSYFSKLTVKREKQTDEAFAEKVEKHDSLEAIFTDILGDMNIAKECGSDGRDIDMLSLQESMIDKPSKWSISDVR